MMATDLPGFADPVADAQACFRAVLDAMSHPGRVVEAGASLSPPAPLSRSTGAVLLTLVDAETPVWLDAEAEAAWPWVRFHCGAPQSGPGAAAFAVCLDWPALDGFAWGSHDGPETSATLIVQRPSFDGRPVWLSGPGLREPAIAALGLPDDFADRWAANHAAFPRGVDLILCAGTRLAAIPRSIRVEAG